MAQEQYERLFARLLITFENGSEIAYVYNRESIDELGLPKQQYDKSTFIEVGNTITIGEDQFEVLNINFKLYPELYDMNNNYGINMYGLTDPTDYNCQIGIFVKQI